MAITTKAMNSPGVQQNLAGAYGYKCLSQRSDGVLVFCYISWNTTTAQVSVLYSYDLGLTWTQREQGSGTASGPTYTSMLSNGNLYHINFVSLHNLQLPCGEFVSRTNINDPFLWDDELDYSASQIIGTMVDDQNKIHVFFKDNTFKTYIYYTIYDPNTNLFSFPELIENGATSNFGGENTAGLQIAMDSTGKIHIVYIETHAPSVNLFYQYRDTDGTWSSPLSLRTNALAIHDATASNIQFQWPSIAIDSNDDIHVCYSIFFSTTTSLGFNEVVDYAKFNGTDFDHTTLYDVEDIKADACIISVDAQDNIYVVYRRNKTLNGTAYDIFLRKSTNGGSSFSADETVVSGTTEAYYPIYLFKNEANFPGYNILNSGCAGVYGIDVLASNSDLRFFYTDDVSYKFPVVASPDFCLLSSDSEDCPYVSSGQVRKMVDTVSGLDHLEGLVVKAQTDGIVPETNEFTVASGQITLPEKAAVVHVGLGYDGIIKFLNERDRNPEEIHSFKVRIFLAALILTRTLGLKVGLDDDHLNQLFDDKDTLPLFSGEQDKLPNTVWDEEAELIIKQDKPLPAHILSVITRSEVESKL